MVSEPLDLARLGLDRGLFVAFDFVVGRDDPGDRIVVLDLGVKLTRFR